MPEQVTWATFEGLIGEIFRVEVDPPLELRLASLERFGEPGPDGAREPFSIHFTGPPQRPLTQRIYALANDQLDVPMIFLVPIGPGADGLPRYEAVFS